MSFEIKMASLSAKRSIATTAAIFVRLPSVDLDFYPVVFTAPVFNHINPDWLEHLLSIIFLGSGLTQNKYELH